MWQPHSQRNTRNNNNNSPAVRAASLVPLFYALFRLGQQLLLFAPLSCVSFTVCFVSALLLLLLLLPGTMLTIKLNLFSYFVSFRQFCLFSPLPCPRSSSHAECVRFAMSWQFCSPFPFPSLPFPSLHSLPLLSLHPVAPFDAPC